MSHPAVFNQGRGVNSTARNSGLKFVVDGESTCRATVHTRTSVEPGPSPPRLSPSPASHSPAPRPPPPPRPLPHRRPRARPLRPGTSSSRCTTGRSAASPRSSRWAGPGAGPSTRARCPPPGGAADRPGRRCRSPANPTRSWSPPGPPRPATSGRSRPEERNRGRCDGTAAPGPCSGPSPSRSAGPWSSAQRHLGLRPAVLPRHRSRRLALQRPHLVPGGLRPRPARRQRAVGEQHLGRRRLGHRPLERIHLVPHLGVAPAARQAGAQRPAADRNLRGVRAQRLRHRQRRPRGRRRPAGHPALERQEVVQGGRRQLRVRHPAASAGQSGRSRRPVAPDAGGGRPEVLLAALHSRSPAGRGLAAGRAERDQHRGRGADSRQQRPARRGDTHAADKPGTNVVAVLLQYGG